MFEDAKVPIEAHVRYESMKVKVFLTPTDKLDELKAHLNRYFIHIGETHVWLNMREQILLGEEHFYILVGTPLSKFYSIV
jgi:hypothetical protein